MNRVRHGLHPLPRTEGPKQQAVHERRAARVRRHVLVQQLVAKLGRQVLEERVDRLLLRRHRHRELGPLPLLDPQLVVRGVERGGVEGPVEELGRVVGFDHSFEFGPAEGWGVKVIAEGRVAVGGVHVVVGDIDAHGVGVDHTQEAEVDCRG